MACNPHFNQTVSEKQISHTSTRKVIEIVSQPAQGKSQK